MTRLSTLEQRITRLEQRHRKRWLRRIIKYGLIVAMILLLLWLLIDAIQLHAALDAVRRITDGNGQSIAGLHRQVDSVQQAVNGIRVKINGMDTHNNANSVNSGIHSSGLSIPSGVGTTVGVFGVLGAIGGLLVNAAKMMPVIG